MPFILRREKERNPVVDRGVALSNAMLIRLAGIYPDPEGWKYWASCAYATVIYSGYSYYIPIYGCTIFVSYMSGDIEMFGQGLCFGCYTVVYGFVAVFYLASRLEINEIMRMTGEGLFTYSLASTEEEMHLYYEEVRKAKNFAKRLLFFLMPVATLQMGLVPCIYGVRGMYTSVTNTSSPINRYTPLPLWTPYDVNTAFSFWFTYWSQMLPGFVQYMIIAGLACFFAGVASNLTGNLKQLRYSLERLFERVSSLHMKRGGEPVPLDEAMDNKDFQKCCYDCLVENIKHHKKIIEYHHRFQNISQYAILAIFAGASVIISTPVYTVLGLARDEADLQRLYTSSIVMTLQIGISISVLFSYCHYGQEVLTQSEEILASFYNLPWAHTDKAVRQLIDIAMSNSQVVLEFKAFLISVPATRDTFLQIIRAAYTLFNILITMRDQ